MDGEEVKLLLGKIFYIIVDIYVNNFFSFFLVKFIIVELGVWELRNEE